MPTNSVKTQTSINVQTVGTAHHASRDVGTIRDPIKKSNHNVTIGKTSHNIFIGVITVQANKRINSIRCSFRIDIAVRITTIHGEGDARHVTGFDNELIAAPLDALFRFALRY